MTLHCTLTEKDCLVFTERYLLDSKSHQALRTKVRWMLPSLLLLVGGYYTWRDGFTPAAVIIFGGMAILWAIFYPLRFDARIRAHARKQMKESSYAKSLGPYKLELLEEHLHSTSPLGSSTYSWSGVDRVALDKDYLFIFLSGPIGYPIRIAEIGQDVAQQAHDFVQERIRLSRR